MQTASERLLSYATDLKMILADEGDELSADDALFVLRQITGMAGSLTMAIELEKVREYLRTNFDYLPEFKGINPTFNICQPVGAVPIS